MPVDKFKEIDLFIVELSYLFANTTILKLGDIPPLRQSQLGNI